MSIQRVTPDNFEYFTIETTPKRTYSTKLSRGTGGALIYVTSSRGDIGPRYDTTGSVYLFPNRSLREKDVFPYADYGANPFSDLSLEQTRRGILGNTSSTDIKTAISGYMGEVNTVTSSLRKQQTLEVIRFVPTPVTEVGPTPNNLRKEIIANRLTSFYKNSYPVGSDFSYSNFHCLNFFSEPFPKQSTSYPIPTSSVLLYPNQSGSYITATVTASSYGTNPNAALSFDFWINPKYTTLNESQEYHAGCVLHLSSGYAVSIHSGSSKDPLGRPDKFKIMLQIGTGSGLPPSLDTASDTNGVFVSSDNALELNKWQHVTINYGGSNYNNGTGSFVVDGETRGNFGIETNPGYGIYDADRGLAPYALCVGNFYEGDSDNLAKFFNANTATREGLLQMTTVSTEPTIGDYKFDHPLNAEVHDLKIYDKYINSNDIAVLNSKAPQNLGNLKFYLPPFFTEESPYRQQVGTYGGVLVTPFYESNGTTSKPFGEDMAFRTGGHYINLENFTRDFVTRRFPRLWSLTGSVQSTSLTSRGTANDYLYTSGDAGAVKKRLYTIMPCDHGDWQPNFNLLAGLSGSTRAGGSYQDDAGRKTIGNVSLRNIVTGTVSFTSPENAVMNDTLGARPENLTAAPGNIKAIQYRLQDGDSNQVVVFDISSIFYGMNIRPNSVTISDAHLSGSDGKFGMTLKDDGLGNIYRADCTGSHATWSSVGSVFYNEGLILLKSPQLFFFGSAGFDLELEGVHNLHIMTVNAYARAMHLLSSSNPNYQTGSYDPELANEPDQRFSYITGINLHDENLNVVARTRLAQPFKKKSGDKVKFVVKLDR